MSFKKYLIKKCVYQISEELFNYYSQIGICNGKDKLLVSSHCLDRLNH